MINDDCRSCRWKDQDVSEFSRWRGAMDEKLKKLDKLDDIFDNLAEMRERQRLKTGAVASALTFVATMIVTAVWNFFTSKR